MGIEYKKISQENEIEYGRGTKHLSLLTKLYSDKTHFVAELIQNADDSKSKHLEMHLLSDGLLIWNDGREFNEEDVRGICSIASSNKDMTQIGTFGIGFKAVYTYTDSPEIYSGGESFRVRDICKPEGIDAEEIPERVKTYLHEQKTVFWLPFKKSLQTQDIDRLGKRLRNLGEHPLLFLRHLEKIHWRDESNGQEGYHLCNRTPHSEIQGASYIMLQTSVDGDSQPEEKFLVFRKEVQPPQDVVGDILHQAEYREEKQRIQRSSEAQQPIEVAFKLRDDKITMMNKCVLFAYLPTQLQTNLRFIIQGRYQTTPDRGSIRKDNPWNKWLVQETAQFLPDILEALKVNGGLEPAFFNIIPLKDDEVSSEFQPITDALQKTMKESAIIPTQKGLYTKAENVFYPHRKSLSQVIDCGWLYPDSSWLHADIRDTEGFRRGFKAIREAGVKEIGLRQVLEWLEKQDANWFESKCEKWLCSLYLYLNSQDSEWERIEKLPLVRLENGKQVCATQLVVFFPPETDKEREEIDAFINELPILQAGLLNRGDRNEIEVFLKYLGVKPSNRVDMVLEGICPQYDKNKPTKPSIEDNRLHVHHLFKIWKNGSDCERLKLERKVGQTPILVVHKNIKHEIDSENLDLTETPQYTKPSETYLSQAYTGNDDLEIYFSVCSGDIWFIDDGYLMKDSQTEDFSKFLRKIGVRNTPRIVIMHGDGERWAEKLYAKRRSTKKQTCIQKQFRGRYDVLSAEKCMKLSQALWNLLVLSLPPTENERDNFFRGTRKWFFRKECSEYFDSLFYYELMNIPWMPDEQGNFHRPSKCFASTPKNRKILGDSVSYLHSDISIGSELEKWLAKKLGIHLEPNIESVLNRLQQLSETTKVNMQKVRPLYRFLSERGYGLSPEAFKTKRLIFTPDPMPRWWRTDEVFWEDESACFKESRGYLKENYPASLKLFFINLEVSEKASQSDYASGIQEIAMTEQADKVEIRKRIKRLYKKLDTSISPDELEWQATYEGRCWLGEKGDTWGFFTRDELVWNDHNYIADIFKGELPFWEFDDLLELAKILEIERCSEAKVEFYPKGDQEDDKGWSEKTKRLRPYIQDFLNSPSLCNTPEKCKSVEVLDSLSVRLVEELDTTYTLKGSSLTHSKPPQSFLEATDEKTTLWLALEAKEDKYAWLIGNALQAYFGDLKELDFFIEDVLKKDSGEVLERWEPKGFNANLCMVESDSKESGEKQLNPISDEDKSDTPVPSDSEVNGSVEDKSETEVLTDAETSKKDDSITDDSEISPDSPSNAIYTRKVERSIERTNRHIADVAESTTPTVNESAKTDREENELRTRETSSTYTQSPESSRSGGHWKTTANSESNRTGGHGGRGGGGEGEAHRRLKHYLANNPSQLGENLELIEIEYRFESGDVADILLTDNSGKPVTVEVESHIPPGDYVGVWQAVKYQHLAAVKYGLACEQVRSILAAPRIPEDVKEKCEELGIEPIEVQIPV